MKRLSCLLVLFAVPLAVRAAGPSEIGFLPEEKVAITLPPTERNPYGKRVAKTVEVAAEEKGTEETQIRDVLTKLDCRGVIQGGGKIKVLLGSFQLEEGAIVPQVVDRQSEKLKVVSIQKDRLEIAFVEKDGKTDVRKISIPYDLKANVHYKLLGQESPPKKATGFGVIQKNEPAPPAQ